MNTLIAIKRSKTDNLGDIRKNGMIPAVVYGARVENTLVSVPSIAFAKIFSIAGETSTIVLELQDEKGESKKIDVLIHDLQKDPIKDKVIHIDFLAIDMNKPIEVSVPLEFIGLAQAEKDGLGTLVKVIYEVEVKALPRDIPHKIEIDVTPIATLEDQIKVKDIPLPQGVSLITDEEEVVALVTEAKEEKEEVPVDLSAIEVEKRGKEDDSEGEKSE